MTGMKPTKRSFHEIETAVTQVIEEHKALFDVWQSSSLQRAGSADVDRHAQVFDPHNTAAFPVRISAKNAI